MRDERHEGGCLCGAVRFAAEGPAHDPCWCHCRSCRRASGAPCVAWVTWPRARFAVARGAIAEHRSSPQVVRGFCAACGSALTYVNEAHPDAIDVTVASLDQAESFAPSYHVWVSHKLPWVVLDDGLPQHAEWRKPPEPA